MHSDCWIYMDLRFRGAPVPAILACYDQKDVSWSLLCGQVRTGDILHDALWMARFESHLLDALCVRLTALLTIYSPGWQKRYLFCYSDLLV